MLRRHWLLDWVFGVAVVGALTIGIGMTIAVVIGLPDRDSRAVIRFDSAGWIKGDLRHRGQMVDDLRTSRLLIGKTPDQVRELLGKPDSGDQETWSYTVDIGHRWGSSPWNYFLRFHFDPTSKTVERDDLYD